MLKYNFEGREENLKSVFSEITINELESIIALQEKSYGYDYFLNAFEILGFSKYLCDRIDLENLIEIIKEFKADLKFVDKLPSTIEIDGFIYKAYDDEVGFKFNSKDFAKIEKHINENPNNWMAYALAIIFKREDLTDVEHSDENHISYKRELFLKHIMADVALPYSMKVSNTYIKNLSILIK